MEILRGWELSIKRNVLGLTGISRGVGGYKPKNLPWEGCGYFLEQHIMKVVHQLIQVAFYVGNTNDILHSFLKYMAYWHYTCTVIVGLF